MNSKSLKNELSSSQPTRTLQGISCRSTNNAIYTGSMQVKLDGNVECELTVPMYDKQANFPVSSTDDQQQRTRHKGTVQNVINKREFAKAVDRKGSYNINNNNNNGKEACKQTHINRCKSKCSNVACKQSHKHTYIQACLQKIYLRI